MRGRSIPTEDGGPRDGLAATAKSYGPQMSREASLSQRTSPSAGASPFAGAELACACVAIACFINVLPNDYCYDDGPVVRDSSHVNDSGKWLDIWTTDYWFHAQPDWAHRDLLYRPVTISSYRLLRAILGEAPWPQHLANILLHAVATVLVVILCRGVMRSGRAAVASGLVFAVLPIHTEVVASVVGRADLLATVGMLTAVLCHARSMAISPRPNVWRWRLIAAVAVFVAMGSKESGVTAGAIVILCDAYACRHGGPTAPMQGWWSLATLRRLAYLLIPIAVYGFLRYNALDGRLFQTPGLTKTVNVLADAPNWQHALGAMQLWGMYWAKTLWPSVLCIDYSVHAVRLATTAADLHIILGSFVSIALALTCWRTWRRGLFAVSFVVVALVITYAPTANVLVVIQVFFAERIWYLPSVWVAILIGWCVGEATRYAPFRLLGVAALLAMGARSVIRNAEWRDNGTLYAAAYRVHPDAVQCLHLYGKWLATHGRIDEALPLLDRAVAIDMGYTDAHRTLGRAHLAAGNVPLALRHLQIANMQVSGHGATVEVLQRARDAMAAVSSQDLVSLRRAAELRAGDAEVQLQLVRRLRDIGQVTEARDYMRSHDDQFRDNAGWQVEFAVTLVFLNRPDEAIDRYRRAVTLDHNNPQVAVELAMLLVERREGNDLAEATELADAASRIAPGLPSVLVCRAELEALSGNLAGARALYLDAIRGLPTDNPLRRVYQERLGVLGG